MEFLEKNYVFDLVLMDIFMLIMDGIVVIKIFWDKYIEIFIIVFIVYIVGSDK